MAQDTFFSSKKTLNIGGNLISLDSPIVMGILNITPDSFYQNSRVMNEKAIIDKAQQMVNEGALILDIGGYSTRPGAMDISIDEEINRVTNAIKEIKSILPQVFISVDTFRAKVAKEAVLAGADIINDISGGELDANMFDTVTELGVPYILMHMKGTPQTMVHENNYENMLLEMLDYFQERIYALNKNGVKDIIIDPGFGFAKNINQNFELLNKLKDFKMLEYPLLVGLSRKSMIYKTLDTSAEEALNGTSVLNMVALQNGANILRVHDVKEAVETVKLFNLTYLK